MPTFFSGQLGSEGAQPGTLQPAATGGISYSISGSIAGQSVVGASYNRDRSVSGSVAGLSTVANNRLTWLDPPARLLAALPGARNLWRLNEQSGTTAYDSIGTDHGTLTGTVTKNATGLLSASSDPAYSMAGGTGNYINIPTITWTPTGNGSFAVSFWLNPSTRTDFNQQLLSTVGWGGFVFHTSSTGQVYTGISAADRLDNTFLGANTLTTGSVQYFTFVYDGVKGYFYKNGVLVNSKTMAKGVTGWGGFRIGTTDTSTINGSVDEVAIFSAAPSAALLKQYYLVATGTQYASQVFSGSVVAGDLTGGTTRINVSVAGRSTVAGAVGITNTTTKVRLTQAPIEVLGAFSPNVRLTQAPIEVLGAFEPNVRLTQAPVEVLLDAVANVRLTQAAIEVVAVMNPNARISQLANEVLYQTSPNARVSQVAVEVLRSFFILPVGLSAGSSLVAGNATVTSPIQYAEGYINGFSVVTGGIIPNRGLSAAIQTASAVSASSKVARGISGAINGSSTLAPITVYFLIYVSSVGKSTVSGTLNNIDFVGGTMSGNSTLSGTLTGSFLLSGSSTGTSTPRIFWLIKASGTNVITRSTVTGTIRKTVNLIGAVSGKSTVKLTNASAYITTGIQTYSVVTGNLNRVEAGPTPIHGVSVVTGFFNKKYSIQGATAGKSIVNAYLIQTGAGGLFGDGVPMRLTQYAAEVAITPAPNARVSQYVLEVIGVVGGVQQSPTHSFGWIVDYGE